MAISKCYVKEVINFGMDSKGNTHNYTLYPFEELVLVDNKGYYARVKKQGKGNRKIFLVPMKEIYKYEEE